MKILAFVDLHSDKDKLKILIKKIEKEAPSIIISAGDTSNFGKYLKEIITEIKITNKILLIIPGNHESPHEIEKISDNKQIINIHKKYFKINNIIFLGYGTGGFSIEEKEFEKLSKSFRSEIKKDSRIVLVTHAPPYGNKIDIIPGLGHRGCISFTKFIKEFKPVLHICGHLHETWYKEDNLEKTIIINPGPEGKIIEI